MNEKLKVPKSKYTDRIYYHEVRIEYPTIAPERALDETIAFHLNSTTGKWIGFQRTCQSVLVDDMDTLK